MAGAMGKGYPPVPNAPEGYFGGMPQQNPMRLSPANVQPPPMPTRAPTPPSSVDAGIASAANAAAENGGGDLRQIALAVQKSEGCRPGTRSYRNNNPGNIEYGPFARSAGAIGSDGRFAIFPSEEVGLQAIEKLLQTKGYRGKTIDQIGRRWAPPSEHELNSHWSKNVVKYSGLPMNYVPVPTMKAGF
jgi:hypothetical protein